MAPTDEGGLGVLHNKRDATRYRILVQIAERQPAVNQQEIADAIGITAQAVSDYLQDLNEEGYVVKHGRGRYEVTKEGVDWLISQTDALAEFVEHISEDVIEQVEIETAIATTAIAEGETVSLTMQDGVYSARAGGDGSATAVAVTDAEPGQDVGITNLEGVVDYELGTVTILSLPRVQHGGSSALEAGTLRTHAGDHDLLAVAGAEAVAAADAADLEPDLRFGTPAAVRDAATRGLDVLLIAATDALSPHTAALREHSVGYEVLEATEESQPEGSGAV